MAGYYVIFNSADDGVNPLPEGQQRAEGEQAPRGEGQTQPEGVPEPKPAHHYPTPKK